MLGPAFHWVESDDGAFLQLRYGCVARVKRVPPDAHGRSWEVHFEGTKIGGRAGSIAQGKRFIESYIEAQDRRRRRPVDRPAPAVSPPRQRTPAEIREWQRREAEHSARMMREAGWRESPSATERPSSKPRGHRNWSWSP